MLGFVCKLLHIRAGRQFSMFWMYVALDFMCKVVSVRQAETCVS